MNKSEFIRELMSEADLSRNEAVAALDAFKSIVTRALQAGEPVTLTGFVKFAKQDVAAKPRRKGIDPFTKEERVFAAKPATVRVKVTPLKAFKEGVATKRKARR